MKKIHKIVPLLLLAFIISGLKSEYTPPSECETIINENEAWSGRTTLMTGLLSSSNSIQIKKLADSRYEISDFTCGFFMKFDPSRAYSIDLDFNCHQIIPTQIESEYGPINITGGQWDPESAILTIHWANEFNQINEKSIISRQ